MKNLLAYQDRIVGPTEQKWILEQLNTMWNNGSWEVDLASFNIGCSPVQLFVSHRLFSRTTEMVDNATFNLAVVMPWECMG